MSFRPIIFGEALFDVFPDGRRVLGGAPFNVAWNLAGLGADPRLISRVGRDESGSEILERMRSWGLATAEIQLDDEHPTGTVRVTLDGGNPTFDIEADQAYDHIDPEAVARAPGGDEPPAIYHGSLALREDRSWRALERLGVPARGPIVCDLNLRDPWWTRERVDWCMGRARWLKISDSELRVLTGCETGSRDGCLKAARDLADRHAVENLVVTRGERGALGLFAGGEVLWQDPLEAGRVVDTVGAGDGFSAMLILGILQGWSRPRLLERAARFASEVCGFRGATTLDRSVYQRHAEA